MYEEIDYLNTLIKARVGRKDISKLTRKQIINKKGHRQTVYIRTTPKEKGKNNWLNAVMSFFGVSNKKIAEQIPSIAYDEFKIKSKFDIDGNEWERHFTEYFSNKEYWDKKFSKVKKKSVSRGGTRGGTRGGGGVRKLGIKKENYNNDVMRFLSERYRVKKNIDKEKKEGKTLDEVTDNNDVIDIGLESSPEIDLSEESNENGGESQEESNQEENEGENEFVDIDKDELLDVQNTLKLDSDKKIQKYLDKIIKDNLIKEKTDVQIYETSDGKRYEFPSLKEFSKTKLFKKNNFARKNVENNTEVLNSVFSNSLKDTEVATDSIMTVFGDDLKKKFLNEYEKEGTKKYRFKESFDNSVDKNKVKFDKNKISNLLEISQKSKNNVPVKFHSVLDQADKQIAVFIDKNNKTFFVDSSNIDFLIKNIPNVGIFYNDGKNDGSNVAHFVVKDKKTNTVKAIISPITIDDVDITDKSKKVEPLAKLKPQQDKLNNLSEIPDKNLRELLNEIKPKNKLSVPTNDERAEKMLMSPGILEQGAVTDSKFLFFNNKFAKDIYSKNVLKLLRKHLQSVNREFNTANGLENVDKAKNYVLDDIKNSKEFNPDARVAIPDNYEKKAIRFTGRYAPDSMHKVLEFSNNSSKIYLSADNVATLLNQFPSGEFHSSGANSPTVFIDKGHIKAVVMPVANIGNEEFINAKDFLKEKHGKVEKARIVVVDGKMLLFKAKDTSRLIKKTIINKNGKKQTVYVRASKKQAKKIEKKKNKKEKAITEKDIKAQKKERMKVAIKRLIETLGDVFSGRGGTDQLERGIEEQADANKRIKIEKNKLKAIKKNRGR